jgi:hypothetical protein
MKNSSKVSGPRSHRGGVTGRDRRVCRGSRTRRGSPREPESAAVSAAVEKHGATVGAAAVPTAEGE